MTQPEFNPNTFGPLPQENPVPAVPLFQGVRLNGQSAVRMVIFSPTGAHCTYWTPDALAGFAAQAQQAAQMASKQLDLPPGAGGLIVPPGPVNGHQPGT